MTVPADARPERARTRAAILLTASGDTSTPSGAVVRERAGALVHDDDLGPSVELRVLTEVADDPFPSFNPGNRQPDVVVELDGDEGELAFDSVDELLAGVTPEAMEASTDELGFVDREQSVSFCTTDHLVRDERS